jgi:hypothetical protein
MALLVGAPDAVEQIAERRHVQHQRAQGQDAEGRDRVLKDVGRQHRGLLQDGQASL